MKMVESNVEIDSSQSAFHDGYPGNCIVPKSEVVEEDICKDGALLKRLLEEGEGCESPQDLDRVCVTYEACLLDTGRLVKNLTLESGSKSKMVIFVLHSQWLLRP